MFSNKRKEVKKESLQIQLEFLDVLQSRHLLWVNASDDPEIKRLHLEILELIRQIKEPYNKLVDIYIYIISAIRQFITYSIISKYNFAAQ